MDEASAAIDLQTDIKLQVPVGEVVTLSLNKILRNFHRPDPMLSSTHLPLNTTLQL